MSSDKILLGTEFPDFVADTTEGKIQFHKWLENKWAILFSHPRDYTPVCTTELARVVDLIDEFKKRDVKVIALSCDSVEDHLGWSEDILHYCHKEGELPYPIIDDSNRVLAKKFGMLDGDEKDDKGIPVTARAVFVIGPDRRMKLSLLYPATTGRNFDEILRVIDSLQLTNSKPVATPAGWKAGDACMIQPTVSSEEASKSFPDHEILDVPSGKRYLRFTKQY